MAVGRNVCLLVTSVHIFASLFASCAWSCSCLRLAGKFLLADSVEVPANIGGIPWWGASYTPGARNSGRPTEADFSLDMLQGTQWTQVEFELATLDSSPITPLGAVNSEDPRVLVLLRPKSGFRPGSEYRCTFRPGSWASSGFAHYRVSAEKLYPPPTGSRVSIGPVEWRKLRLSTASGACSEWIWSASREIHLDPPPPAVRFQSAMLYVTTVDGHVWRPSSDYCELIPPGCSWVGSGKELLFGGCGEGFEDRATDSVTVGQDGATTFVGQSRSIVRPRRWGKAGLEAGSHDVVMTGWLPGTPLVVTGHANVVLPCR